MLLMAAVVSCVTVVLLLALPNIVVGLIGACMHVCAHFIVACAMDHQSIPISVQFLPSGLIRGAIRQ